MAIKKVEERKFFEKINGKVKPPKVGNYSTNFGELYFDGHGFIMGGHDRITHTIVEWWLTEYKPQ